MTVLDTETFTYDDACNIISSSKQNNIVAMTYDIRNRLKTVSGLECIYDADGNMTIGLINGSMLNMKYDSSNRLISAGTYIFTKNNEYHILFTEKGKVRSDIVTNDKREVLWNAIAIFSTNIIMNFAICNREKGKDFRRAFFAKEKEIFSLFGKDFEKRKDEEIQEILKRNPYNDI